MEERLLYKYITGEASEQEVQSVFEWMEESAENRKELIRQKQTWAISSSANENADSAWNEMKDQIKPGKRRSGLFAYLKYAAVAILLLGVGAFTQKILFDKTPPELYSASTSFEVPSGQISCVVLPDGTLVHLNSESSLKYPNNFSKGNRIVELSGEGYFNVHSDNEHPFIVKTPGKIHVKVHGTAFNLRAYKDENKIHTILEEGSVSIINNDGNELTKLVPGEKASYSMDANRLRVNKVKTELFSSWKDGMITFRNESLGDIARMMQRWYNVKIEFEEPELAKELYNGTIMKNKPLDQILEVFRITSSLEYKVVPQADKPTLIYWKKNKTK